MTENNMKVKKIERKFDISTPGICVDVKLNDGSLGKTFEMFYASADMHLNFMFNMAKDLGVSGEIIKAVSAEIKNTAAAEIKELENSAIQAEAVISGQGISAKSKMTLCYQTETHTPHSFDVIKLFQLANRSLEAVRLLWVAGIISDDERASSERSIRSRCHTLLELISKNFKRILSASREKKHDRNHKKAEAA